jgi:hypothetical protein
MKLVVETIMMETFKYKYFTVKRLPMIPKLFSYSQACLLQTNIRFPLTTINLKDYH